MTFRFGQVLLFPGIFILVFLVSDFSFSFLFFLQELLTVRHILVTT